MNPDKSRGVTMIELMVVVGLLAILSAIGIPSFKSLILGQKVKAAAAELQINLNLTRAEALKRNAVVSIKANTSNDWKTGWNVTDPVTGSVLSTTPATVVSITGPDSVNYRGSGRVDAASSVSFQVSATGTNEVRCISVEVNGMSVTRKGAC